MKHPGRSWCGVLPAFVHRVKPVFVRHRTGYLPWLEASKVEVQKYLHGLFGLARTVHCGGGLSPPGVLMRPEGNAHQEHQYGELDQAAPEFKAGNLCFSNIFVYPEHQLESFRKESEYVLIVGELLLCWRWLASSRLFEKPVIGRPVAASTLSLRSWDTVRMSVMGW